MLSLCLNFVKRICIKVEIVGDLSSWIFIPPNHSSSLPASRMALTSLLNRA